MMHKASLPDKVLRRLRQVRRSRASSEAVVEDCPALGRRTEDRLLNGELYRGCWEERRGVREVCLNRRPARKPERFVCFGLLGSRSSLVTNKGQGELSARATQTKVQPYKEIGRALAGHGEMMAGTRTLWQWTRGRDGRCSASRADQSLSWGRPPGTEWLQNA
jgi:hypothetical protein